MMSVTREVISIDVHAIRLVMMSVISEVLSIDVHDIRLVMMLVTTQDTNYMWIGCQTCHEIVITEVASDL